MTEGAGPGDSLRVAVLASGQGSLALRLVESGRAEGAGWRVVTLLADRPCPAVERVAAAGVPASVVGADAVPLLAALEAARPDLVVLAGYLRLVPAPVIERYAGRIVNTHPALLPAFGGQGMYGLRVHRAVVEAGVRVSGCTIHLVDERFDEGRILAQWPVPVSSGDTPEALAERVQEVERSLLPQLLHHWAASIRRGDGIPRLAPPEGAFLPVALDVTEADPHSPDPYFE